MAAVFTEIKAKIGGVAPPAYRALAVRPHILQANWNRTKRVLGEGNLSHASKAAIALAVSAANACHFCVAIHTKNLLK